MTTPVKATRVDTRTLRLRGYSVTSNGHIDCHAAGAIDRNKIDQSHRRPRFEQEHCALIRIDGPREVCEKLIEAADSPRALAGFSKTGAVLLFRHDNKAQSIRVTDVNLAHQEIFQYAVRGSSERVVITIKSEGMTVDTAAYTWPAGRSPLELQRDFLPILTSDVCDLVVKAAANAATLSDDTEQATRDEAFAERAAKYKADLAAGLIKIETPEEAAERADLEIVAAWEGREIAASDGLHAAQALRARARVADRKKQAERAAEASDQAAFVARQAERVG